MGNLILSPITSEDDAVQRAASQLLLQSPHSALKAYVTCRAESGSLVVEGTVPSYYLKQVAQETIRPVIGRHEIINLINVKR